MDFSPTTAHLFNDDNDSGGGGSSGALISRSGSLSSEARGTRPRVPSVVLRAGPSSAPALAPAPIPVSVPATVPAPREMQQRGPGTAFVSDRWLERDTGVRYAYGNSVQPFYDTVRQQQPPPPPQQQQQQQLQYQPQQRQWQQRWQQQEERPLPPDLPTDVGPIPTTLMPSHRHDPAVFNIPFATTVANPSRPSVDGDGGRGGGADGTWGSRTGTTRRERRQTQQVPLPPAPGISRKIPDMLGRNVESSEDINASVDEDRRNRPRVLKVRRLLLLLGLCVADWERAWVWQVVNG